MKFFERTYDDYWAYESSLGEFLNTEMANQDVHRVTDLSTDTLETALQLARDELQENMRTGRVARQAAYTINLVLAELYLRE